MPKPSSTSWMAALIGVCAISYGLGNGWIRLGPPSPPDGALKSPSGAPAPLQEFSALDPSALAGLEPSPDLRRSAPIDDQVRRTQAETADVPITDADRRRSRPSTTRSPRRRPRSWTP